MKILLVTEFFPDKKKIFSGGVETRTFFIAQNLAKKHKVFVICRRKEKEKKYELKDNLWVKRIGLPVKETSASFFSIFSRLLFIYQSTKEGLKLEVDLVEGSNFICYLPAFLISFFKKIPVVAWYPDLYGKEWFKNYNIGTAIFGFILEKIGLMLPWRKVIALSKETKKKLIKASIPKEKIKVIYGGIDLNFIKRIKSKKYKKLTICCVSRLVPYKRIDCLIKAIHKLKSKITNIRCLIIGKGPEEEKLKKMIKDLNLERKIIFRKDLSYKNLIKTLKASHLFCLPSLIEGFGLVTIEAVVCGLPFLITDIPINREITKEKGGLFFKPDDADDLALKAEKILKNSKFTTDLIKNGRSYLKRYDWSIITSQTEEVYRCSLINSF